MKYLLDASSIVNLVKRGRLKPMIEGSTIDLAVYEAISAVWKECHLLKKMDEDVALELLDALGRVFDAIGIESIKGSEKDVFQLALKEDLTIYDASYVYKALKEGLIFITDDEGLRDKASKLMKAMNTAELVKAYSE